MTILVTKSVEERIRLRSDEHLVRACLEGQEEAWSELVDKYKNLIFSIPIKYGFTNADASDIFQSVCLELLNELPKLREPRALPKWIIEVTSHKCFHWKRQMQRVELKDPHEFPQEPDHQSGAEELLRQAEQEQLLRQAVTTMSPRCQKLIQLLFFQEPARPYSEVAETLGLATGSIGFIRQRCLDQLRRRLGEMGF